LRPWYYSLAIDKRWVCLGKWQQGLYLLKLELVLQKKKKKKKKKDFFETVIQEIPERMFVQLQKPNPVML
jgi:hypothetical protein